MLASIFIVFLANIDFFNIQDVKHNLYIVFCYYFMQELMAELRVKRKLAQILHADAMVSGASFVTVGRLIN